MKGLGIPKYRERPSLLLHKLPEQGQPGVSKAALLKAQSDTVHCGEHSESGSTVLVLGPSGAGKTRTIYELLCGTFGFYHSFSRGREPGTTALETTLKRFITNHEKAYDAARADSNPATLDRFRERRSTDALKLVVRILLAHALGLRAFLWRFGIAATPKKFLQFQLVGAAGNRQNVSFVCAS